MKQRGRSLGKTLLSATLAVIMVVEMLPWTAFAAFAANGAVKEEVVSALAEAYDGDEARAREELEALREVGIIDEDGNPVELDIQEDGVPVTLADVTARIGGGAETGNLTVNGHAATREQLMQIQSANAMMDVVRMMGEDVEITDEHVANFERLVQGIADGSVDIDAAIEQGSLSVDDIESAGENGADMEQASLFADDMESAALLTEDVGVTRQLNFASGEDPIVITCPKGVVSDETATMTIALKAAQSEAVKCVWEVGPGLWNGRSVRDTVSWSSGESDPKTVTFNVADVMEDIFDDDGNPFFDEDGNMEVPFSPDNPYITIHTYTYFGTSKQFSYHNMTTVLVIRSKAATHFPHLSAGFASRLSVSSTGSTQIRIFNALPRFVPGRAC